MSVLCFRYGFMFCVTFPASAFSYIFILIVEKGAIMHCNFLFSDKIGKHIDDLYHVNDTCDAPSGLD